MSVCQCVGCFRSPCLLPATPTACPQQPLSSASLPCLALWEAWFLCSWTTGSRAGLAGEEMRVSERQCPGEAPHMGSTRALCVGSEAGQGAMAGAVLSSPWPRGLGGQQASCCCCCCDIPPSAQDRHLGLRAGRGARPPSACLELAASERQRGACGSRGCWRRPQRQISGLGSLSGPGLPWGGRLPALIVPPHTSQSSGPQKPSL